MRKMWMTVGLLATLGLSACGVGTDDPEALAAMGVTRQEVTSSGQVISYDKDGKIIAISALISGTPTKPGGGDDELPQDPVPIHGVPNPLSHTATMR